jgi:hypothetical protein
MLRPGIWSSACRLSVICVPPSSSASVCASSSVRRRLIFTASSGFSMSAKAIRSFAPLRWATTPTLPPSSG